MYASNSVAHPTKILELSLQNTGEQAVGFVLSLKLEQIFSTVVPSGVQYCHGDSDK